MSTKNRLLVSKKKILYLYYAIALIMAMMPTQVQSHKIIFEENFFFIDNEEEKQAPAIVQKFVRDELSKLGISNASSIIVCLSEKVGFAGVLPTGKLIMHPDIAAALENALADTTQLYEELFDKYRKMQEAVAYNKELTLQEKREARLKLKNILLETEKKWREIDQKLENFIALCSIVLKHEASHLKNVDYKRIALLRSNISWKWFKIYCVIGVFIGYKSLSESTQSWNQWLLCSFMVLYGTLNSLLFPLSIAKNMCARDCEREADEYACENAENRKQLEQFYAYFKDDAVSFIKECHKKYPCLKMCSRKNQMRLLRVSHYFFDAEHPFFIDRAAVVKKYIQKWDDEHQGQVNCA
jgi:hypothetical protein